MKPEPEYWAHDAEVRDMKEDYRKVFGEECTPSWHLAALP